MKHILVLFFFFLLCYNVAEAQTYANIPGPENVLVVYKVPTNPQDTLGLISDSVKTYYVNARGIPSINKLGLNNLDVSDTVSFPSGDVWMDQYKEVYISSVYNFSLRSDGTRIIIISLCVNRFFMLVSYYNKAAWECYVDRIATPIENYLNNTYVNGEPLRNTIRYIVLCKGVPMKLLTYIAFDSDLDPNPDIEWNPSYTTRLNVSIDALTCLLFNPVITLYGTSLGFSNPYYNQADMTFTFNNRFVTNHFHYGYWYLNYLVTRLDGNSYNDIAGMIDRSVVSDYSGEKWWIMDADTCHSTGVTKEVHNLNLIKYAQDRLNLYDFNTNPVTYDPDCNWILDNSVGNYEPVMGYTSCGRYSWIKLCNPEHDPAFIQLCFDFNYANGAIYNTFESFNGYSMSIDNRYFDHSMLSEFIKMGGTGGVAHTWEPMLSGVAKK